MNELNRKIQGILEALVAEGKERGIQVAAYFDGELAVDACAGVADRATGAPVTGETLFPVFSVTKGIVATLIHLLAERRQLDYDAPIARYWPEFAAKGKGGITVRHALNHTAGLPNMPAGIGPRELGDWDAMCRAVAELEPVSPPGREMVYHAITFGWILGELAHRADGRAFPRLLRDEICVPLGLCADLLVGAPESAEPRIAVLECAPDGDLPPAPAAGPCPVPALFRPLHEWMNRPAARRACVPASNGIMTARAIARHYAALLRGGVDGVELLPPRRVWLATEPQGSALPPALEQRRGLGYSVGPSPILGDRSTAFGHGGHGGSTGFADPERRMAFALTRNRCSAESSAARLADEIRRAIGRG